MKKVVTPAEQGLDTLCFVPANLKKLFLSGAIGSNAWFLGLQLVAKMLRDGRVQTTMTMREANQSYVSMKGAVVGGALQVDDPLHPITAMQELHLYAGLLSHYSEAQLQQPDAREGHFTNDPFITFGDQWSLSTPIVFLFDHMHMDELSSAASQMLAGALEVCEELNLQID